MERLLALFRHRRAPFFVVLIGLLLTLPSIGAGYVLDDHLHRYILDGNAYPGGPRGSWDLYRFADGADGTRKAIDEGLYPWWANPSLRLAFFRPIASLWRAADHQVFGTNPIPPHIETCLVYAALCAIAAVLYRRELGGAAATVAGLFYAIDDAHAMPTTWIANRYALLSAGLSLIAIGLHVRARRAGSWSWGAPIAFALAMFSGETALGALGFIAAFEICRPEKSWGARIKGGLIACAPLLGVFMVWAVIYSKLGYGGGGNAFYVDPARTPLTFFGAVFERGPKLLLSEIALPPSEIWALSSIGVQRIGFIAVPLLVALFSWPIVARARRHPSASWLALGSLLAIVPACATLPDDRMLLLPGFGSMGVLALALQSWWRSWRAGELGISSKAVVVGLVIIHGVLAPLLLPLRGQSFVHNLEGFVSRTQGTLPSRESMEGKDLVVVSTVDPFLSSMAYLHRYCIGFPPGPRPRARLLTVQQSGESTIERVGERSLEVRSTRGMNSDLFSSVYRKDHYSVGEVYRTEDLTVHVLAVDAAGYPTTVRFDFDTPLETKRFVVFEDHRFVEVELEELDGPRTVQATDYLDELSR